jgi:hypothetical protein
MVDRLRMVVAVLRPSEPGVVVLPLDAAEAPFLRLQGGVDGVAAADELVQAEGEGRKAALGVLAGVASQQRLLQRGGAAWLLDTGELTQLAGRPLLPEDAARLGPDQATTSGLAPHAQAALDPARQRVDEEGGVVRGRVARQEALAQGGHEGRVVGAVRGGGAAQGLADDVLGPDLGAEEQGGYAGDLAPLLVEGPRPGQGRRGADALAAVGAEPVANPPHEQGHVLVVPACCIARMASRTFLRPIPRRGCLRRAYVPAMAFFSSSNSSSRLRDSFSGGTGRAANGVFTGKHLPGVRGRPAHHAGMSMRRKPCPGWNQDVGKPASRPAIKKGYTSRRKRHPPGKVSRL